VRLRKFRTLAGRRAQVEKASFPGYLFINVDPTENRLTYASIRSSWSVGQ